jgi:quinol monooxygenase YgiN
MEPQLTVVAEMVAKPGKEDELRNALLGLIEPTRRESGCVQYDLHESADQPGRFLFFENWRSKQDLDEHLNTPHLKDLGSRSGELLAEPMRIATYRRLR